ncbi:MAG TPA: NADH:ubiquinone oxidoreductase [Nitrospirota bacterium]
MKPKVAVFALTSCEGCSLQILNLEDHLLDLLGQVELVNFREAMDEKREDYDIAFIDGCATTPHDVEELKKIRAQAKVLIAMGACAVQGGLYAMRNFHDHAKTVETVYGKDMAAHFSHSLPVRPLSHYVKVDHNLYGCPMDKFEFVEVVRSLLLGKAPNIPDYPLCNECRAAENICVFDRGMTCFGPITRAGCGAICPANGKGCEACRGLVSKPFIDSHKKIMKQHGLSVEDLLAQFREYNGYWEETHEKSGN